MFHFGTSDVTAVILEPKLAERFALSLHETAIHAGLAVSLTYARSSTPLWILSDAQHRVLVPAVKQRLAYAGSAICEGTEMGFCDVLGQWRTDERTTKS